MGFFKLLWIFLNSSQSTKLVAYLLYEIENSYGKYQPIAINGKMPRDIMQKLPTDWTEGKEEDWQCFIQDLMDTQIEADDLVNWLSRD